MREKGGLDILEALENLNTLVDADSLEEIEVTDDSLLIPHKGTSPEVEEALYWSKAGPDSHTLETIKVTFRSVYVYLQNFYKRMRKGGDRQRLVSGINTIMVLVGEAAKKLDNFGVLFKSRVQEFEEYKQLQNFYRERVIKESFQDFAKVPIAQEKPPLSKHFEVEEDEERVETFIEEFQERVDHTVELVGGAHLLNDLELIKQDHLYELFHLKNESGHNFYTNELARNIKLICDFASFTDEYFGDDPLLQIKNWEDKSFHLHAQNLLKKCSFLIGKFYKGFFQYKEMELVNTMNKAVMALMLAANPRNLIRQFSLKGSHLYFHDFLLFLREVLQQRDYQKFLIYSPPQGQTFFQDLIDLVNEFCLQLFTLPINKVELENSLKKMIEKSSHQTHKRLSDALIQAHAAISDTLKRHPNGPVFKAVDLIREDATQFFDPIFQGNIPEKECSFIKNGHEIALLRTPCPILQEIIEKAYIIEEFKTFLRRLGPNEKLLFINYQDRTSWTEHARCVAIEELSRQAEFAELLTVVTLAKETDFYNQKSFYEDMREAHVFMDHFIQHLGDEITGYYFPQKIKKELFKTFMPQLMGIIHKVFFNQNSELSAAQRREFIQIGYYFIELKILELVQPTYLTLSSKDGLDITATATVGLIALLELPKKKKWQQSELDHLFTTLFGMTLMNRERVIHLERFERLISLIKLLETKGDYLKEFHHLYSKDTLDLRVKFIDNSI